MQPPFQRPSSLVRPLRVIDMPNPSRILGGLELKKDRDISQRKACMEQSQLNKTSSQKHVRSLKVIQSWNTNHASVLQGCVLLSAKTPHTSRLNSPVAASQNHLDVTNPT